MIQSLFLRIGLLLLLSKTPFYSINAFNSPNLNALSCSSRTFVTNLRDLIANITEHPLRLIFTFKHSFPTEGEIRASWESEQETLRMCDVTKLVNCEEFVFSQVSLHDKRWINILHSLLQGKLDFASESAIQAFVPVVDAIHEFRQQDRSLWGSRVEAGGGSGFGFQMYCDDRMVLTAGGGGGGGLEGLFALEAELSNDPTWQDVGSNHSYGAGAGAGLQFDLAFACTDETGLIDESCMVNFPGQFVNISAFNSSDANSNVFVSLGGGGGCGIGQVDNRNIIDISNNNSSGSRKWLQCGSQLDSGVFGVGKFMPQLLSLLKRRVRTCESIRVEGGGGGGGGTAECCAPTSAGFGFNFSFAYLPYDSSENQAVSNVTSSPDIYRDFITGDASGSQNVSESEMAFSELEQNPDSYRQMYDPLGAVIHQSSGMCGGFSNWSCICVQTQSAIGTCIDSEVDYFSFASVGFDAGMIDPNSMLVDCAYIRQHASQLSWASQGNWCLQYGITSIGNNSSEITIDENSQIDEPGRFKVIVDDLTRWKMSEWNIYWDQVHFGLNLSCETSSVFSPTNQVYSWKRYFRNDMNLSSILLNMTDILQSNIPSYCAYDTSNIQDLCGMSSFVRSTVSSDLCSTSPVEMTTYTDMKAFSNLCHNISFSTTFPSFSPSVNSSSSESIELLSSLGDYLFPSVVPIFLFIYGLLTILQLLMWTYYKQTSVTA